MSNSTIIFTPTRAVISGWPLEDPLLPHDPVTNPYEEYTIPITLQEFGNSTTVKKSEATSMSGRSKSSLFFYQENYSCKILLGDVLADVMNMFAKSCINGEVFTMTNLDETDRVMNCKLTSEVKPDRENYVNIGKFSYTFSIKEVEL